MWIVWLSWDLLLPAAIPDFIRDHPAGVSSGAVGECSGVVCREAGGRVGPCPTVVVGEMSGDCWVELGPLVACGNPGFYPGPPGGGFIWCRRGVFRGCLSRGGRTHGSAPYGWGWGDECGLFGCAGTSCCLWQSRILSGTTQVGGICLSNQSTTVVMGPTAAVVLWPRGYFFRSSWMSSSEMLFKSSRSSATE